MLDEEYDCVSLLEKMRVRVLCTTDDPLDSLEYHRRIREDASIPFRVAPSFRPDRYLDHHRQDWEQNCGMLCAKYHTGDLKEALGLALDFFVENGCRTADHGFTEFHYEDEKTRDLMLSLGGMYAQKGIVMQLHLSPLRNNSRKLFPNGQMMRMRS